jgi:hypothetical protein
MNQKFIPVISVEGKPLMPTSSSRARRLIKCNKAVSFFKFDLFCIRLKVPVDENVQSIAIGVDPGSKKEGYTVKSAKHTYLNIQSDAKADVKDKIEARRNMRRGRRFRNTPCRKPRWANRGNSRRADRVPPSTKARWDLKFSIIEILASIFPIKIGKSGVRVEDIKAQTKKGAKKWNKSFSPLECGKKYFYNRLRKSGYNLSLSSGYSTYIERMILGLYKTKDKLSDDWHAHCVDSWVMANKCVGGHCGPDNTDIKYISPILFSKRQLHKFQFKKGDVIRNGRTRSGGTRSLGFAKGSIILYIGKSKSKIQNGRVYLVGGNDGSKLSLHSISSYERLNRTINPGDCKFLGYNKFTFR